MNEVGSFQGSSSVHIGMRLVWRIPSCDQTGRTRTPKRSRSVSNLLVVTWDCWQPRALSQEWRGGQLAFLWALWHCGVHSVGCMWMGSQWPQGTFQETQLGISEAAVRSKHWLTLTPRNLFSQFAALVFTTSSYKTVFSACEVRTPLPPSEGRLGRRAPLPWARGSCTACTCQVPAWSQEPIIHPLGFA